MSNSALASLTAQYTDSENEDDLQESPDSQTSVIPPQKRTPDVRSQEDSSASNSNEMRKKKKKSKKAVKRLVSYQDDTIISDEAADESEPSTEESDSEVEEIAESKNSPRKNGTESPMVIVLIDDSNEKKDCNKNSVDKYAKYAHYSFTLPTEPKAKPMLELTEKIKQLYDKMESSNMDMNRLIQQRKDFRNPSIYEKLIQFCDINEFGTNYPPHIYDPLQWGPESYYEELAKVQKNEMLKRQKEKKDSDKIEQVSALARKVEEEAKKRKSKWDQPITATKVPLTTTVTGTKGTVISAFGSLPKKPNA